MISERHRHRYEFNCLFEQTLADKGLQIVGRSLDGKFVEIIELPVAPVVRGGTVPPRVQVEATAPAPAVCRLRRREPSTQALGAPSRHRDGSRIGRRAADSAWRTHHRRRRRCCSSPAPASSKANRTPSTRRWRFVTSRARGRAVRLQGVVRQGEPHVGRVVPRSRARRGAADSRTRALRGRCAHPDRHPRSRRRQRRSPKSPTSFRSPRSCPDRPTSWSRRRERDAW